MGAADAAPAGSRDYRPAWTEPTVRPVIVAVPAPGGDPVFVVIGVLIADDLVATGTEAVILPMRACLPPGPADTSAPT